MSSFRQIAVADLTIINKTDLVNEEELAQIRATVRSALHAFSALIFPRITELVSFSWLINFDPKPLDRPGGQLEYVIYSLLIKKDRLYFFICLFI